MNSLTQFIYSILRPIRAHLMRFFRPKEKYLLFPVKSLNPISSKFGFDRGTPVDRYYIEQFLSVNSDKISGTCLEIHDTHYTEKFGGDQVARAEALDVDHSNKQATVYADLRNAPSIPDNSYDCVILTHTLGVIDDFQSAIKECYRILKPGGSILVTVSAMGVAQEISQAYWRFTETSLTYAFSKHFKPENIHVMSYGNVLAGQAFWVGLAAEELEPEELQHRDPRYAVIVGLVAIK